MAFATAAALVNQLMEARDERRLLKLQRDLAAVKLLIVDELGYVPLSPTGAGAAVRGLLATLRARLDHRDLQPAVRGLDIRAGSERLTGALLDRLTHHVSILTMNGDSYRLRQSTGRRRSAAKAEKNQTTELVDHDTGEILPP